MEINYLLVALATVISVVLGMGWFGPLFGKAWAEIIGMPMPGDMTPEEAKAFKQKMVPIYMANLAITIVMMWTLFLYVGGAKTLAGVSGLVAAFSAWFGFVMPIEAANALWSGKPRRSAWMMFALTAGYQLLCFVIAGALYSGM